MKSKQIISAGILLFIVSVFAGCSKKDDNSTTGTCSDGIQNQTETGVDCGGPCSACAPLPIADFTFTGAGVQAPASVAFTNSSTNATSYSWNFGDGGTSTATNPSHNFVAGGTYNVALTATGTGGSNSKTHAVTILAGPTQMRIDEAVLDTFPFTKPGGGSWDPSDGPDIYFKIIKNGVVLHLNESFDTYPDVSSPTAFISWLVIPAVSITPITATFTFEIWDDDGASDELMGTVSFIPSNYPGQPAQILGANGTTRVNLTVVWL